MPKSNECFQCGVRFLSWCYNSIRGGVCQMRNCTVAGKLQKHGALVEEKKPLPKS